MRDAAHQSAPDSTEATASQYDEPRTKLLGQPHDLRIGPTELRVRPCFLAAGLPSPPHLLVEPPPGLFLDALLHPPPQIRIERPGAGGLIVGGRHVPHIDEVQL